MLLRQRLNKRPIAGDVGIEIEVEGKRLPNGLTYWRCENDGSLRGNSIEYVLRRPMTMEEAKEALNELDMEYKANNTEVFDSVRTGVHVHINVLELSEKQVWNFVCCYIALEPVLVKFCGPSRVGNLFCLRCQDAEFLVYMIKRALKGHDTYARLYDDDLRYASINLKALREYGSIEFRSMRGTRDLSLIYTWAIVLLRLRDFSARFENPVELVTALFADTEEFVAIALGEFAPLFVTGHDSIAEVQKSGRYSNDIAHSSTWKDKNFKYVGGIQFDEEDEANEPPRDM